MREVTKVLKVLLVDDHPVVREGLRTMLANEPGIEVVSEASDGEEAISRTDELEPDVVLMDIRMPGMSGIEATRRIKKTHPTISVIIVTMYDSEMYMVEAVRAGAAGYVTKIASQKLLCHAIRSAAEGGTLVRTELLHQAIQGLLGVPGEIGGETARSVLGRLSPRELEVLKLLARGQGNRDICKELHLAEITVKKHVQSIIGKLGVSDRTQAAILGVQLELGS